MGRGRGERGQMLTGRCVVLLGISLLACGDQLGGEREGPEWEFLPFQTERARSVRVGYMVVELRCCVFVTVASKDLEKVVEKMQGFKRAKLV